MARAIQIRDRDKGARAFQEALVDLILDRPTVTIGVHPDIGAKDHPGHTRGTIADVALAQEFRPRGAWLRGLVDTKRGAMERDLALAARRTLTAAMRGRVAAAGHFANVYFGRVALKWGQALQRRVFDRDLFETGTLLGAIEGRVRGRIPEGAG